jgi:hypothetical protein
MVLPITLLTAEGMLLHNRREHSVFEMYLGAQRQDTLECNSIRI